MYLCKQNKNEFFSCYAIIIIIINININIFYFLKNSLEIS